MNRLTGPIAIVIAAATTTALAHNGAVGVVLERMNGMTAIRDLVRDLAPMMQGTAPYDPIQVSEAGYVIASHAGETMRTLFPTGSLTGVTYAKPNIWTEWDEFSQLADELRIYAEELSKAASNGPAATMSDMGSPQPDVATMTPSPSTDKSQKIAALLGYVAPQTAEVALAMTATKTPSSQNALTEIRADIVFEKITGTCSACHSRFRNGRN